MQDYQGDRDGARNLQAIGCKLDPEYVERRQEAQKLREAPEPLTNQEWKLQAYERICDLREKLPVKRLEFSELEPDFKDFAAETLTECMALADSSWPPTQEDREKLYEALHEELYDGRETDGEIDWKSWIEAYDIGDEAAKKVRAVSVR
jgi:hypothetical protein